MAKNMSHLSLKESIEKVNKKIDYYDLFIKVILACGGVVLLWALINGIVDVSMGSTELKELYKLSKRHNLSDLLNKKKETFKAILIYMLPMVATIIGGVAIPGKHFTEKQQAKKKLRICARLLTLNGIKISRSDLKLAETVTITETVSTNPDKITTTNYIIIPTESNVVVAKEVGNNGEFSIPVLLPEDEALPITSKYSESTTSAIEKRLKLVREEQETFG